MPIFPKKSASRTSGRFLFGIFIHFVYFYLKSNSRSPTVSREETKRKSDMQLLIFRLITD